MTKTKAGRSTIEDSGVSLSHMKDILNKKETYKQLLQQQQNSFKSFVQILVDSTNKIMDDLTREVQDLKNSLQFSQGQLDELKLENGNMAKICKSLREDISSV
jgi:vacuolar-type H+-ATPase subunit D/Vma8